MKLTVFSDCHGNLENAIRILTESEADCYLFCGDGIRDAESAADLLDKRLIAVLGNCDRGETGEAERLLELDGVRILLTHGHGYSVKSSLLPLRRRALELDVQLVLYGHTHLWRLEKQNGITICNTGSITFPKGGNQPTFATYENGVITLYHLDGTKLKSLEI